MAAECTETSVVNPNPNSSAHNWWHEIMHANSLCSWTTPGNGGGAGDGDGVSLVAASSNNNFPWQHSSNNHSSESSGEDDVSISNQSVLTAESSRQLVDGGAGALAGELIGETTSDQNHLWSHFLFGGSTRGGMEYKSHHPQQVVGEGMLNLSSSSSTNLDIMSNCDDYLKKMGTAAYEFNLSTAALKDPGGFINHPFGGGGGHETQRPPAGMLDHHHHQPPPPMFAGGHPCGQQLHDVSCICSNVNTNHNNNNSSRELNDFSASFQSYLSKPLLDINHEYKPTLKTLQYLSSSSSPAGYITKKNAAAALRPSPVQSRASTCSTLSRGHGRGQGIVGNEGRKKKTEDNTEKMNLKRPKNNDNPASKMQVPKVKLADKITALQQIVSPFGKTDTASVLWEAIGHIRFLQEQIQLLTNAYAKSNARKDVPWGGLLVDGRKDVGGDAKVVDLRSRGLCLVPISYTPQIYRESNASDYLIPTYRGCLYG
nr:transcription factor bHLH111 isoform X2 [Ipomoea batatas]